MSEKAVLNPKIILLNILDIVNFQGNKEEFANKFLQVSLQQSFIDLIQSLPREKKTQITQEFSTEKSANEIYAILRKYFLPYEYLKVISESSEKFFNDYIRSIQHTLSQSQKKQLEEYLASVKIHFAKSLS